MLNSLFIAFSLYSILPMPRAEWSKRNMQYALAFFPLVGLVVGGVQALWLFLGEQWALGPLLRGAGAALWPALLSGGIHLDGFCDTCDALGSRQTRERKLEILKDSHTGAFALIGLVLFFTALTGLASELRWSPAAGAALAACFVLSRAMGGLFILTLPCARGDGLARTFSDAAAGRRCIAVLWVVVLLAAGAEALLSPLCGAAMLAAWELLFLWARRKILREFGGVTGDLAGWSIQLCELILAGLLVVLQKSMGEGLLL